MDGLERVCVGLHGNDGAFRCRAQPPGSVAGPAALLSWTETFDELHSLRREWIVAFGRRVVGVRYAPVVEDFHRVQEAWAGVLLLHCDQLHLD